MDRTAEREALMVGDGLLARLRDRIGLPVADVVEPWAREASRDVLRRFAHGVGDDNPLWCDPIYAGSTRHAGLVAPPSFLFAMSGVLAGMIDSPPRLRAHWLACNLSWNRSIRRNEEVTATAWLTEAVEGPAGTWGESLEVAHRIVFETVSGEVVAEAVGRCVLAGRGYMPADAEGRVKPISSRLPYDEDDLVDVFALYAAEGARGAATLYWDDVRVGDRLPRMAKGPMTVSGTIAYAQGAGGLQSGAHRLAWGRALGRPGAHSRNRFDVAEGLERLCWEHEYARALGLPGPGDFGPERAAWLMHQLTDWMGDDGALLKADCRVHRFNPEGDAIFIDGVVTGVDCESGRGVVTIRQTAANQDGVLSASGSATVELPIRG